MNKNHKNIKVEIARIIACLLVIALHLRPSAVTINGQLNVKSLFIECLCSTCVTTFFLISGFYIYDKKSNLFKDWFYLICKYIKRIYIPAIVLTFIALIFQDYILGLKSFVDCVKDINIYYISSEMSKMVRAFLAPADRPYIVGHFWYIFYYSHIIFFYPITRLFLTKINRKIVYALLITAFIYYVFNDYNVFIGNFEHLGKDLILSKPIYYSIVGYIFKNDVLQRLENEDNTRIINAVYFKMGLLVYILVYGIMAYIQGNYYIKSNFNFTWSYATWLSPMSLIMSCALLILIYSINFEILLSDNIKKCIIYVGSKTLYIYYINSLITNKISISHFDTDILTAMPSQTFKIIIWIMTILLIFVVSFFIVIFIEFLFTKLKKLLINILLTY